ncbi:AAA-ATPase At2g18193-like [Alnus glutinosa]|uniref:AAA-ATPase At2g18193-like n=1 Tax=Alnus glutinosa TaxID=3517 RepID=UPI002D7984C0|nr:AAA-ATPase At2g18193-like [Alnus glutinosa]
MNSAPLRSFTSSLRSIPTASSWFDAYVALSTSLMLLQTATNQLIPANVRSQIYKTMKRYLFGVVAGKSSHITIRETWENMGRNELYDAVKEYISSKISRANRKLRVGKLGGANRIAKAIEGGESIADVFDNIKLTWRYSQQDQPPTNSSSSRRQMSPEYQYVLSFDENDLEKVMDSYLPHILDKYKAMKEGEKVLKHYTRMNGPWQAAELGHPATFDTLAMEPELKKAILDDLDRFLRRKSFYKKVGKAWKRGYLLYGPPGTGKTSLIAAMANYLRFDIYDLELSSVFSNADLMQSLRNTSNRSILVIEDIDCNREVRDRLEEDDDDHSRKPKYLKKFTLSGLLNSIDGLWTSSAEERIIVFTTNHKEQIDPALLRPGRMDMHINLSFCTFNGFRLLASNYLDVQSHPLFEQVEHLLETTEVTPAAVAEELMKDDDADVALSGLVKFLKRKEMEDGGTNDVVDESEVPLQRSKKMKIEEKTKIDDEQIKN